MAEREQEVKAETKIMTEKNSILIRLPREEWEKLVRWLDCWDNVVVAAGDCPKVYLLNMTRIHKKSEKGEKAEKEAKEKEEEAEAGEGPVSRFLRKYGAKERK